MPYRTYTDQIDGVVLVLIDVAELNGTKPQLDEDESNLG